MRLPFYKLFIVTQFFSLASMGQNFEGTLVYDLDLTVEEGMSKLGITKSTLIERMKEEGSWADQIKTTYSNSGDYYSLLQSDKTAWAIYRVDSNKVFTFRDGSDVCTITDVSIDVEERMTGNKPLVEKLDTVVVLDNRTCNIVRVKWKSAYFDYYYSADYLKMSSDYYKNYIYDGWYGFMQISNALPLRIVKVTKGLMTVTYELKDIQFNKVERNIFNIPQLSPMNEPVKSSVPNRTFMKIK